jgi:hypothetical protein
MKINSQQNVQLENNNIKTKINGLGSEEVEYLLYHPTHGHLVAHMVYFEKSTNCVLKSFDNDFWNKIILDGKEVDSISKLGKYEKIAFDCGKEEEKAMLSGYIG